jgi:hypothetical protein
MKRILVFSLVLTLFGLLIFLPQKAYAGVWDLGNSFKVSRQELPVYDLPKMKGSPLFRIYRGFTITPTEIINKDGYKWFKFGKDYYLPAIQPGGIINMTAITNQQDKIKDSYGFLEIPHQFAVKLVKEPGARGQVETYKKMKDGSYQLRKSYPVSYAREGIKSLFGDKKTVGGNVVRYMYRTKISTMNGWDSLGRHFGVYKIAYPLPHDALPHLLSGRIALGEYNEIPVISTTGNNGRLFRHPLGRMGGDIVLHTARKGSLGCINIENDAMSRFFHEDVTSREDYEIVPLVIYDEGVEAPELGKLF